MKPFTSALKNHYAQGTTTIATCWRATLLNGTIHASTSLDKDVVFDGVTYVSSSSYASSNVESTIDLNPDNLEVQGFLAFPFITADDMFSGAWDYAKIEIFEVNYNDTSMGRNLLRVGTLGTVKAGRSNFSAELRGLLQAYSRNIVSLTTKDCIADLGDSRCKVNLSTCSVSGTVTATTLNRNITAAATAQAVDYFTAGKFTFTSGLNSGLSMEVKSTPIANTFELQAEMPFAIAIGDTFVVSAGCTKRFVEDCKGKFNNTVNFRGFPHLPGVAIYKVGVPPQ